MYIHVHGVRNEQVIIIIIATMISPCELLTLRERVLHGLCVLFLSLPPQDDTTPLYMASQQGHLPVVQTLLQHGAKVDLAKNVCNCSFTVICYNLCTCTHNCERSDPPSRANGAPGLYIYTIIIYIFIYIFILYVRPFWPLGGPALRANVGGRFGNQVSPTESAFSACIGSGSSSLR